MKARVSPWVYPVIAAVCWGGNFTVGRAVGPDIPAVSLAFWRWALATLVLLPFVWPHLKKHLPLMRRHGVLLLVLAVLGAGMFQVFVYLGLQTTTTINAALFMSVIPLAIPVAAYAVDRERTDARLLVGIVLSLVGVAVVTVRGDVGHLLAFRINAGDLWVLASVPVWAVYSVLLKRLPRDLPPLLVLFTISGLGVGVLAPFYGVEVAVWGTFPPTAGNLAAIGYVAVFAAVIAFATWNRGVAELGAARAGIFLHLIPVSAALLAIVFLGEGFEVYHAVGIPLVGAGLWVAARKTTP